MKRNALKKYGYLGLVLFTQFVQADAPQEQNTFTGNVSLVSDYRFRGISQTMRRPAVQGGFDYAHDSGVYLGTWGSNVDGTTHFYNNTSMEWDFYGGFKDKVPMTDIGYNIGVIRYYYPGGKSLASKSVYYNTTEWYTELSYEWLSVKFWQTMTNYFGVNQDNTPINWHRMRTDRKNGDSRGSRYIEANVSFDLIEKVGLGMLEAGKLSLQGHIGHQKIRHYEHLNYSDWKVTLTQDFKWLTGFISYVGTNARRAYYDVKDNRYQEHKRHLGDRAVVVGVTKSF